MGTQVSQLVSDCMGLLAVLSLAVAVYVVAAMRTALPLQPDVFENVAWGKFFVGAVYGGLAVLCFWMFLHRAG
jgi:hypothetical protein